MMPVNKVINVTMCGVWATLGFTKDAIFGNILSKCKKNLVKVRTKNSIYDIHISEYERIRPILFEYFDIVNVSREIPEDLEDCEISNLLATLHLLPTAPKELIKTAYECLVMLWHPDTGTNANTDKFQEVHKAYKRLKEIFNDTSRQDL